MGVVSSHRPRHFAIDRGERVGISGRNRMRRAYTQPLAFVSRLFTALASLLAVCALMAGSARAGDFPDRLVKVIVPFSVGGTADAVPRLIGDWLSRKWGQGVVIENRTGAGGN